MYVSVSAVAQVMRNTSHASRVSRSSSPLVSLRVGEIFTHNSRKSHSIYKSSCCMATWSVPNSSWLLVPPTRGVRRPLSCLSPSCCPPPKRSGLICIDRRIVLAGRYERQHLKERLFYCGVFLFGKFQTFRLFCRHQSVADDSEEPPLTLATTI